MNKLNLTITSLFILFIGLSTGYALGYQEAKKANFPLFETVGEINPKISLVKLLKIENNQLIGAVEGQKTRLAYNPEKIIDLKPNETFKIPLNEINLSSYDQVSELPEGTQYISSRSGKYFYHILDPRALRITPKNRLYFKTKEAASNEGYLPPK